MTKTELLKQIKPGDSVYFDFSKVYRDYTSGWYEYVYLETCGIHCSTGNNTNRHKCPGKTYFKGINSKCLVWSGQMPVKDIIKTQRLPDHLFEIEI